MFGYENGLVFPIYVSDEQFEDFLLLINDGKSYCVYIKDFDRFIFQKTKDKNKKWFCRSSLQCFSSKNLLIKQRKL